MELSSILLDSGLENISNILNTRLHFSPVLCSSSIKTAAYKPSIGKIQSNQACITMLRSLSDEKKEQINTIINNIVDLEKEATFFFEEKKSLESLESDTFGQLLFQYDLFKVCNHMPFLLMILSYFKIFITPCMSFMLPICLFFVPFFLIRYVWGIPIKFAIYKDIMLNMWGLTGFDNLSPQKLLQNAFTVFTMAQSMYQPIQNAFHLYTIDSTITTLGTSIINYQSNVNQLRSLLKEESIIFPISTLLDDIPTSDIRRIFVELLEDPYRLWQVAKDLARFEILWNISKDNQFNKVLLLESSTPYLKANNIADINLAPEQRVGSSLNIIEKESHYLLSGPNGGGKSSFLRGVLQTLLFSQSYGYSSASNVEIVPFDYILSGLHIQDIPGKKSLFEKEICFARDVLYYNNPEFKGFVLFDEIFHSTNPPDCIKSSNVFLQKLWSYDHVASIVSTHVFEIIDSSPTYVKKICVDAQKEEDVLIYSYKIQPGVCKESSVQEIWKKSWIA